MTTFKTWCELSSGTLWLWLCLGLWSALRHDGFAHGFAVVEPVAEGGGVLVVVGRPASLGGEGALDKHFGAQVHIEQGIDVIGIAGGRQGGGVIVAAAHEIEAEALAKIASDTHGAIGAGGKGAVELRVASVGADAGFPDAGDGEPEELVQRVLLVVGI